MTGDDDAVHTALDALDAIEDAIADPTELRDAVRLLAADAAAAEFVLDELAGPTVTTMSALVPRQSRGGSWRVFAVMAR